MRFHVANSSELDVEPRRAGLLDLLRCKFLLRPSALAAVLALRLPNVSPPRRRERVNRGEDHIISLANVRAAQAGIHFHDARTLRFDLLDCCFQVLARCVRRELADLGEHAKSRHSERVAFAQRADSGLPRLCPFALFIDVVGVHPELDKLQALRARRVARERLNIAACFFPNCHLQNVRDTIDNVNSPD